MKLALYQGSGTASDVLANLALLAHVAEKAANQGADFLVLPELFLTGYNISDDAWRLAEPKDGPSIRQTAKIALDCKIAILLGYSEVSEGHFYNSAVLIDRDGHVVANYRKVHLFGPEERRLLCPATSG